MEKIIQVKISLDDKVLMETRNHKIDVTDEVFDSIVDAVETSLKDKLNFEDDEFCNDVLGNYGQSLPENFKNLKDMGLKIEVIN